jgi:hypothetical protein
MFAREEVSTWNGTKKVYAQYKAESAFTKKYTQLLLENNSYIWQRNNTVVTRSLISHVITLPSVQ